MGESFQDYSSVQKANEYDQEMLQSQTNARHLQGRETEH